jgi:hypothetical protein
LKARYGDEYQFWILVVKDKLSTDAAAEKLNLKDYTMDINPADLNNNRRLEEEKIPDYVKKNPNFTKLMHKQHAHMP